MSFADELNEKVNEYNIKQEEAPTDAKLIDIFIDDRIKHYADDIKTLCTVSAGKGGRNIKGFFVPKRKDYGYDTTTSGPSLLDQPKKLIQKKPQINTRWASRLDGGAETLREAAITLNDDIGHRPIRDVLYNRNIKVTESMIESVRLGVIQELERAGFKKLIIECITGPNFQISKPIFKEVVVSHGFCRYFYLDIEW